MATGLERTAVSPHTMQAGQAAPQRPSLAQTAMNPRGTLAVSRAIPLGKCCSTRNCLQRILMSCKRRFTKNPIQARRPMAKEELK